MDRFEEFVRARVVATDVIGSITDEQLHLPTPCSEWNVRNILNHILMGDLLANAWIRGVPALEDREADYLGDDPQGAVMIGLAETYAELSVAGVMERVVSTRMGELTVSALEERRIADLVAHLWDLAIATGQPTDYDPELVEEVLAHYRGRLEGAARTGMPVAEPRPAPESASAADRLAAYLGRTAVPAQG